MKGELFGTQLGIPFWTWTCFLICHSVPKRLKWAEAHWKTRQWSLKKEEMQEDFHFLLDFEERCSWLNSVFFITVMTFTSCNYGDGAASW